MKKKSLSVKRKHLKNSDNMAKHKARMREYYRKNKQKYLDRQKQKNQTK